MDNAGSFVYAKASGIIGKSFIGSRAVKLFEVRTLGELWSLLFNTPVPVLPEVMLAQQIERESFKKLINQYSDFIELYEDSDGVLKNQLKVYEGQNLKVIGAALCSGETQCPELIDLGNNACLKYKNWPNIEKITLNTEFDWYNQVPEVQNQRNLEYKVDIQILKSLWKSINLVKDESKEELLNFYKEEYAVANIVWALRLKIHYKMTDDKIKEVLMYVTEGPGADDPIAKDALKILDKPLDEYEAWANWKYKELINPHVEGQIWQINPGWIEQKYRAKSNRKALHLFHQYPMTTGSLIGWYKVKEYELNCIRTAVESIRLNINSAEAMKAVGLTAEER